MQVMSRLQRLAWDALPLSERRKIRNAEREKTRTRPDRDEARARRQEDIAVFDVETDPFDNANDEKVLPFLAVLYRDDAEPVVIWDEDYDSFCERCYNAIEQLPRRFIVYAHNGGRFDWLFLVHRFRGKVTFKGRGLMSARIGNHELRDSYHLIPEKLAAFQKDEFDYSKLTKARRNDHREEITNYCIGDCRYTLQTVKAFIAEYGPKLTIGQAALAELKKHYKFDRMGERLDKHIRQFFYGGRVECLQGSGRFVGPFKLYDVNSMYPNAMANFRHPASLASIDYRNGEQPNANTYFIRLRCRNNGALVGNGFPDGYRVQAALGATQGIFSAEKREGEFRTTKWEYDVAMKYGLLEDVEILECIDFHDTTDFSDFILPRYAKRELLKQWLADHAHLRGTAEFIEVARNSIFLKLLLNNAYGKFAQNPEKFMEQYLTDLDEYPEGWSDQDEWTCDSYDTFLHWQTAAKEKRYNNVAVAASITGAARSVLLEAIQNAFDPIYCDTDSLICRELRNVEFSPSRLGAWDLEAEFDEVLIVGKKMYAARNSVTNKQKLRAKGVSGLIWDDYLAMLKGRTVCTTSKGVTIYKDGTQQYLKRNVKVTAPRKAA
jgi:DNA polymerase type B, organellar and viral